jgi:hypothetical protein
MDETNDLARGTKIWKRHSRRVHSRARETLEVVLADRLHLGRCGPDAKELRAYAKPRSE